MFRKRRFALSCMLLTVHDLTEFSRRSRNTREATQDGLTKRPSPVFLVCLWLRVVCVFLSVWFMRLKHGHLIQSPSAQGERWHHSRCSAALLLIAVVLALAAVASESHQRSVSRPLEELHLKERPLATHYHRVDPHSFSYRSERSVGPAIPSAQEERQQATPPGESGVTFLKMNWFHY